VNPKNANRPVFDASAVLDLMLGEAGADKLRISSFARTSASEPRHAGGGSAGRQRRAAY